jgi:hypothetical protein
MRDTIDMAREANVSIRGHYDETGSTPQELERFAALVRADEREAIEDRVNTLDEPISVRLNVINKAIRARGQA